MMRRSWRLALLLAIGVSVGRAADVPAPSEFDRRIRYVDYNAEDVVEVDAVVGIVTHIVFEPGERYVTHAFGDAKAWAFKSEGNHVFIKAVAEDADCNLAIVTDKRSYHLRLKLARSPRATGVYQLAYRYPEVRKEKGVKAAIAAAWDGKPRGKYNLAYTMAGDLSIAPVNAWDNGEFTFFRFPGNRDIPSIYMVDDAGNESIVERHTSGAANETVVLHKVNAKWVVRLEDQALAVYNEAFDTNGVANNTGTASPKVQRVVKGAP